MPLPIEKNMSIPMCPYERKYPFPEMEVGDSFVVPEDSSWEVAIQSAWKYKRAKLDAGESWNYTTRSEPRRIWRTE